MLLQPYMEDENQKELYIPYVHLSDNLVVCAVHVNGCKSQFPKGGLITMAGIINKLKEMFPDCDIISPGDFNTPPEHIEETIIKQVNSSKLLVAEYPTHVNPNDQAANYDNVVIVAQDTTDYELFTCLSEPNQALVDSIKQNRKIYLDLL